MINSTPSDINISEFKPETVAAFQKMYSEKKELLEYLAQFGNAFEKSAAALVLGVGGSV